MWIDESNRGALLGVKTCREWFTKFKKGEFNLVGKPRSVRQQEFDRNHFHALWNVTSLYQYWNWLKPFNQSVVIRSVQSRGEIKKE